MLALIPQVVPLLSACMSPAQAERQQVSLNSTLPSKECIKTPPLQAETLMRQFQEEKFQQVWALLNAA